MIVTCFYFHGCFIFQKYVFSFLFCYLLGMCRLFLLTRKLTCHEFFWSCRAGYFLLWIMFFAQGRSRVTMHGQDSSSTFFRSNLFTRLSQPEVETQNHFHLRLVFQSINILFQNRSSVFLEIAKNEIRQLTAFCGSPLLPRFLFFLFTRAFLTSYVPLTKLCHKHILHRTN